MSDRQQSEEPEEQVDLEGDDDNDVMDDDEDGYRRRRRREDSDEPDDDEEDPEVEGDGHGDAGTAAGEGGADEMDKAAGGGGDGPEDDDEKRKWDELLALPPQGSEVFIGGLPRDTTEEDLRELCDSFGEIYEVRLMKDKETKENKGFAFVNFTAKEAAQRAIEELHDKEHKGRTLRCSLSQAKHRLFVGNQMGRWSEWKEAYFFLKLDSSCLVWYYIDDIFLHMKHAVLPLILVLALKCFDPIAVHGPLSWHTVNEKLSIIYASMSQSHSYFYFYMVKTIYVKNLPENASKEKIKEIFEKHGEVTKVVLPPAKDGHKRDFGFVHFAERSSALKAVKGSEKYEFDGQVLEVSMAKPLGDKKPDHSFKPAGAPNFPLPPYGGYMGDPYGAYGGGGPGFNQPMIYGRGPAPAGMRMVPMVLPDGRLGYVLQQPGGIPPPPPMRRGDRRDGGSRGGEGSHGRRYRPY
uniref:RRM domain-containing protein n=1 Tax=Oryza barthii TaxID=65489 RepID=A0A0D3HK57_9ORYZ